MVGIRGADATKVCRLRRSGVDVDVACGWSPSLAGVRRDAMKGKRWAQLDATELYTPASISGRHRGCRDDRPAKGSAGDEIWDATLWITASAALSSG
jgi:hypothetical protein